MLAADIAQRFNNILYTPLDVEPKPEYDRDLLRLWIKDHYGILSQYKQYFTGRGDTAERLIANYPWDLTVAYLNMDNQGPGWLGNFDLEFSELAHYLYSCFNFQLSDLGTIVFLPIRSDHTGLGFWHNDTDPSGLRHYLQFDRPDVNRLLLRKTRIAYDTLVPLRPPISDALLQDRVYECQLASSTQAFYLNNQRAVHSTYTALANQTRIACFVTGQFGQSQHIHHLVRDLIVRSADLYRDHAIFWEEKDQPIV